MLKGIRILILMMVALPLRYSTAFDIRDAGSATLRNTIFEFEDRFIQDAIRYPSQQLNGLDAWVDDSELKWSNSDISDFDEQKLSYEIKLKNSAQIRAEQQILNMGHSKVAVKQTEMLEKRLGSVYNALINNLEKLQRSKLLNEKSGLANAELNNWKLKVNSENFRADKLQQADLTLESLWAQALENNASISRYANQNRNDNWVNSRIREQTTSNLISIQEMIMITQDIAQSGAYQEYNTAIQKSALDAIMSDKQQLRNQAKNSFSVNSFKLEYDNKNNDLGFSIGVKVPITHDSFDSLLQAQQRHYSKIDAQYAVVQVSDQLNEKQFSLQALQDRWLSHEMLLAKIKQRIRRLSGANNIDLQLALKQEYLQTKIQQQATYSNALRKYVDFLNTAGMLAAKPYRNWIKAGIPHIM